MKSEKSKHGLGGGVALLEIRDDRLLGYWVGREADETQGLVHRIEK